VTERLPAALQEPQRNAILSLLSERTLLWLEEMQMNPDKIPMSAAALRFKAALQAEGERKGLAEGERRGLAEGERRGLAEGERRGLAEGERKALRMLLRTRGLSATVEEHAVIAGCTDPKQLEQWIVRAVSAGSVGEVLGTNSKPRTAKPRTKQRAGR
jgi:flagellar biosynthesis/type III secretory pathway protein FliH